MLKQELLSIWKDKKFTLSIIVMIFMPLLYSGMLLWAFWDPYAKLEELPVALVNEDKGAVLDGEEIALGDELIQKLMDEKQFDFFVVTSEEAEKRLLNQDYYLLIKIPENFSEHATTLLEDNPEKLQIEYLPNEGYNFLSAKIGDTAIEKIRTAVNDEVAQTYAETLYDSIDQLNSGFAEAADGATNLNEGALKVKDGTEDLKGYLQQLAKSSVQLSSGTAKLSEGLMDAKTGANKLAQGTNELSDGTTKLNDGASALKEGATNLQQGITDYTSAVGSIAENQQTITDNQIKLQDGAQSIKDNTVALAQGTTQLQQAASSVNDGMNELAANLEQLLPTLPAAQQQSLKTALAELKEGTGAVSQGLTQLAEKSNALSAGTASYAANSAELLAGQQKLTSAVNQLNENSPQLTNGVSELLNGQIQLADNTVLLQDATKELNEGAYSLASGIENAVSGSTALADGTTTLVFKSSQLAEGASTLAEGTRELAEGSNELKTGLKDASEESEIAYTEDTVNMTVSPVEVNKEVVNKVENYGSGFAPYFISLGLFVGALLLTNVYPYVQPSVHPTSVMRWFGSKSFIPLIVMIGQVVLILLILMFALGLKVDSVPLLILTTIVVSFAFMAIVQVLTVVLGDVGRFLALLFLIIQLTSSAGTFPVELLPGFFQKVHDFMPMKYAIQAYRDVIAGQYINFTNSLLILTILGVVCVVISFAYFAIVFKRRYSKQTVA